MRESDVLSHHSPEVLFADFALQRSKSYNRRHDSSHAIGDKHSEGTHGAVDAQRAHQERSTTGTITSSWEPLVHAEVQTSLVDYTTSRMLLPSLVAPHCILLCPSAQR